MSRVALIALLAAWLASGIGGKVARYAPEQEAAGPRAERLVREFLGAYGWSLAERQKMTRAGLYTAQIFNKAGCDQRIAVAVLGAADEAADVAVDQLGQDVVFLEDGHFSARPSAGLFFAGAARAGLTLESHRLLPTLAVAPAPRRTEAPCTPPPAGAWANLGRAS
jgi:hypothetical protein